MSQRQKQFEDSPDSEPAAVVDTLYELLSFPAGSSPDWSEFNALFVSEAVLALRVFPGDDHISVLSLPEYAEAQMQHGLGQEGYSEKPGERTVSVFGDVATIRQTFEMNFAGRRPIPAIDIFSLARTGGRWLVVSVVSDTINHAANSGLGA